MIRITSIDYDFLYELIEDYKDAESDLVKADLEKQFVDMVWGCGNEYSTYQKFISFRVLPHHLETDVGKVFLKYSHIPYTYTRTRTAKTDWRNLIKQKVNNLYGVYFDKNVIVYKEYMAVLKKPKDLYFEYIAGKEINTASLERVLENYLLEAKAIRNNLKRRKVDISIGEFREIIDGSLIKALRNCKLVKEYEKGKEIRLTDTIVLEDNFYIKYFCKSIDGDLRKWMKKYYGVRDHKPLKRCVVCQGLIENTGNRKKYCEKCAKESAAKSKEKYRKNHVRKIEK